MPIPNEAFFGLDEEYKNIFFGDIRNIINNKESNYDLKIIKLIELRIKRILNEPLLKIKNNRDPYLLATLTSQGIEVLGQIFHPTNENEKSKPFREIANQLHQNFSRKISKENKERLKQMWGDNKDISKIDTFSYLLYRYLRNDLTHFFVARGVYLSYEETETFKIVENENEAYIIINPNWYYDRYVEIFNDYFYNKVKTKKVLRDKAINYINNMIK